MKSNLADFAVSFDASICLNVKRIQIHRATSQRKGFINTSDGDIVMFYIKTKQQKKKLPERGEGEDSRLKKSKNGYLQQCQWLDFNFDLNFEFTIM